MKQQTIALNIIAAALSICSSSSAFVLTFVAKTTMTKVAQQQTTQTNNHRQICTASSSNGSSSSSLNMGLFDGVKEAFNAPPGDVSSERETPIDRWMGWNSKNGAPPMDDDGVSGAGSSSSSTSFIDAMDAANYVTVSLEKPMGIVFEENDKPDSGVFVTELKEGGVAEQNGKIQNGDQLIAVNGNRVYGLEFDDALGAIIDAETPSTELLFFRGPSKQFYGKTGASEEWLAEFIGEKKYQS